MRCDVASWCDFDVFMAMRTTVTLDPDVQALILEAAHHSGKRFKATLNDAIRAALAPRAAATPVSTDWPSYDMGVASVDLTKALALADELDDAAAVVKPASAAARRAAIR